MAVPGWWLAGLIGSAGFLTPRGFSGDAVTAYVPPRAGAGSFAAPDATLGPVRRGIWHRSLAVWAERTGRRGAGSADRTVERRHAERCQLRLGLRLRTGLAETVNSMSFRLKPPLSGKGGEPAG